MALRWDAPEDSSTDPELPASRLPPPRRLAGGVRRSVSAPSAADAQWLAAADGYQASSSSTAPPPSSPRPLPSPQLPPSPAALHPSTLATSAGAAVAAAERRADIAEHARQQAFVDLEAERDAAAPLRHRVQELQDQEVELHEVCLRGARTLRASAAAVGAQVPPWPPQTPDLSAIALWTEQVLGAAASHLLSCRSPAAVAVPASTAASAATTATNGVGGGVPVVAWVLPGEALGRDRPSPAVTPRRSAACSGGTAMTPQRPSRPPSRGALRAAGHHTRETSLLQPSPSESASLLVEELQRRCASQLSLLEEQANALKSGEQECFSLREELATASALAEERAAPAEAAAAKTRAPERRRHAPELGQEDSGFGAEASLVSPSAAAVPRPAPTGPVGQRCRQNWGEAEEPEEVSAEEQKSRSTTASDDTLTMEWSHRLRSLEDQLLEARAEIEAHASVAAAAPAECATAQRAAAAAAEATAVALAKAHRAAEAAAAESMRRTNAQEALAEQAQRQARLCTLELQELRRAASAREELLEHRLAEEQQQRLRMGFGMAEGHVVRFSTAPAPAHSVSAVPPLAELQPAPAPVADWRVAAVARPTRAPSPPLTAVLSASWPRAAPQPSPPSQPYFVGGCTSPHLGKGPVAVAAASTLERDALYARRLFGQLAGIASSRSTTPRIQGYVS